MGKLERAPENNSIGRMSAAGVKARFKEFAPTYNKILDNELVFCHTCGTWKNKSHFYNCRWCVSGLYPICKECLLNMACDYDEKNKKYIDNKEKTINVFRMLDKPFLESVYQNSVKIVTEASGEKNRSTAYQQAITTIQAMPYYRGMTFKDSIIEQDTSHLDEQFENENELLSKAREHFGIDYPVNDLIFLEKEYEDWISRYPCENKSQEILFESICFTQLNINKSQRTGKDTKELLKTLQDLMASLQIKPSQNNSNSLTDAKTFSEMIEDWELTQPIPEPSEEFKDVDKIGLYIDVFFKGHLSKMMNFKNGFSRLYDTFMKKLTVNKPEYTEDSDSEEIFDKLFGDQTDV